MKGKKWLVLPASLAIVLLANSVGGTMASFVDQESSSNNTFEAWTSTVWVQTSQTDFEAGVLDNVDTSTSPGNVTLETRGDWYDGTWEYRKPINITNSGSALTNYQVKVTINTQQLISAGKMESDGDDIRFTTSNGITEIDYWIESGINTATTEIWVEVPSIPTTGTTIYMYYGNPSAISASNVSATFSSGSFTDTFTDSSKINTTDSFNISVTDGHVEIDTHTNETTLTATGDARVVIQDPNAVHGSETHLALQQYTSGDIQRNFIQFDITSIPQNVTVNDVDFKIYYYVYLAGNPVGQNTRAKRVTGAWTENTITWNNQPDSTISDEVSLNMPGSYGWVNYDADAIVQSWLNGSSTNYGFLVKFNTEYPTPNRCPIFYSKDYADDNYRPKLTVNWTEHETTADLASVLIPNDTSNRLAVGDQLSWNNSEPTNTDVEYQIEYKVDGSWELIPDSVLAGNSAGFNTSPVDISAVKTDYGQIRLKGSLSTTDVSTTPTVDDWTITYYYREYTSPEPTASVGSEEGMYVSPGTIASQVLDTAEASANWYDTDWSCRKRITVDHTKVNADLTDFPVLISLSSDSDLAAHAQGDGDDIVFTSSDGTTKLSHEVEGFDSSTGKLIAWVKAPSLSGSTDTDIYMYYGNSACGNQEDIPGVWDSNFKAVWHLNQTTGGSGAILDSTSNNNDGTDNGSPTLGATGQIGNAIDFNGTTDYIQVPSSSSLKLAGGLTIEAWMNVDNWGNWKNIVFKGDNSATNTDYQFALVSNGLAWDGTLAGTWRTKHFNTPQDTGTWIYAVVTHNTITVKCYRGDLEISSQSDAGAIYESDVMLGIAAVAFSGTSLLDGKVDEVRISDKARSEDWIKTCCNNQNSPSSFYSLGLADAGTRWDALFWDETLDSNTDITFEVRASDTLFAKGDASPSWTSVGGTSPVTSGLPSGRYMQWRATLTTSDPSETPVLHEVRVYYS